MRRCEPTHRSALVTSIGEAPGACEVLECDCPRGLHETEGFVGKAGRMHDKILAVGGLSRKDINLSNVVKYRPPGNDFSVFYDTVREGRKKTSKPNEILEQAMIELKRELEEHRPNVAVAWGNEALKALCGLEGITHWRGSILESRLVPGLKVIPMLHPSSLLPGRIPGGKSSGGNWQELWIAGEIVRRKVVKEAKFFEIRRRPYVSITRPDFHQVESFFKDALHSPLWSVDIETRGGHIACFAVSTYFGDATWALCVPINTTQGPYWTLEQESAVWSGLSELMRGNPNLVTQNGWSFDMEYLIDYGCFPSAIAVDLMPTFNRLHPELPKSLEFLTMLYTDMPYYKAEGKTAGVRQPDEQLWEYNNKDVVAELWCAESLVQEAEQSGKLDLVIEAHKLLPIALEMQQRGLEVDLADHLEAGAVVDQMLGEVVDLREGMTGKFNVRSNPQMARYLYAWKWVCGCEVSKEFNRKPSRNSVCAECGVTYRGEPVGLGLGEKRKRGTGNVTADEKAIVELMMKHPSNKALKLLLAEKKLLKAKDYTRVRLSL